jgi:outer membrane lipoprotein-sorting protein
MKTKLFYFALIVLLPSSGAAQTADDVVKKYVEARGGAETIKAVQSERVTGHIIFGPGVEGPFLLEFKRPLKLHMEATIQGHSLVRVYDGKSVGWIINPFDEEKGVQPMTAEELNSIADESDFDGPLVDYKAKGNQIELAGKDELDGKPVYKLKLTRKNGDTRTYYIDASDYLVVQWDGITKLEGKEIVIQNFLHDYRDVNGLKFPFEVDTAFPDAPEQRRFIIEKVELNPPIDDTHFAKPIPPPAPADAPAQSPATDKPPR